MSGWREEDWTELLGKNEMGNWDVELGPNGGIVESRWTCPYCGQTFETSAVAQTAIHSVNCDQRPNKDQQTLDDL